MLRSLALAVVVSAGVLVAACGSEESSQNSASDGCVPGSKCNTCANCEQLCVCATSDFAACQQACIGAGGGGGSGGYPVGGAAGVGGGGGGATGGSGGTTPTGGLATALVLSMVDWFQGVRVGLMQGGNEVSKNAPIVAGREAMMRVYVLPDADYQPREIVARVEIGGSAPGTFDAQAFIGGPSAETDPNSTLNVSIPAANVTPDATYTVSLLEVGGSYPGSSGAAKFGPANLGAKGTNGPLHVVLVPVVSNGIEPKTDAGSIQAYHDRLMKLYAAPEIEIQVRQAVSYSGSPSYSGSGWGNLLDFVMNVRASDGPPANSYYYGVVTPTQSFSQYCPGGCVAGLSNSTHDWPNDILGRTGTGIGFFPSGITPTTVDTMAHEVGHTLGLDHAPCSMGGIPIQNVDPAYPYAGAKIGTWGWDIFTKNFLDPNKYTDVMAYCDPTWVADWTFGKLFQRLAYANGANELSIDDPERAPGKFETAIVENGSLSWGTPIDSPWPLMVEKKQIELVDAAGNPAGSLHGFWYPTSHGEGGMLLVRKSKLAELPTTYALKPAGMLATLPVE